jgi:hypothetical protein
MATLDVLAYEALNELDAHDADTAFGSSVNGAQLAEMATLDVLAYEALNDELAHEAEIAQFAQLEVI